jgi:mannose-6-phosphate isomerase-like protein (cupin superfamily)
VTAGQVLWLPAETHHGTNTGKGDLKLLVVEFKQLQGAAMKPDTDKGAEKDDMGKDGTARD